MPGNESLKRGEDAPTARNCKPLRGAFVYAKNGNLVGLKR